MEQLVNPADLLIAAEVQVVYKTKVKPSQRYEITTSESAYNLLLQHWDKDQIEFLEQAKVIFLNCANKVLGIYAMSTGCLTGTVVDPRTIFAAALKANAHRIILAHNHPSGNLKPSQTDIQLTNRVKGAGNIIGIRLQDHLIITSEGHFSFADQGLL